MYSVVLEYSSVLCDVCFFFFFQAEDGIRDHCVTGVQTCALPISSRRLRPRGARAVKAARTAVLGAVLAAAAAAACVERMTAPGNCPDYCPGGQVTLIDSLLATSISRDSAFRGCVMPNQRAVMPPAARPRRLAPRR